MANLEMKFIHSGVIPCSHRVLDCDKMMLKNFYFHLFFHFSLASTIEKPKVKYRFERNMKKREANAVYLLSSIGNTRSNFSLLK